MRRTLWFGGRRRLVYGHRLAPQGSRFIPENPSDRQVSDTDQNTTLIREMHWEPRARAMRYQIDENGVPIPKFYEAEDLRHVEPAIEREVVVIQPPRDEAEFENL